MIVIQRVGVPRALRHFVLADLPSQSDMASLAVAVTTWHNVAVHFVTRGTIAMTLSTIKTDWRTRMRKSWTIGYLLGGGDPSGFTSLTNAAASWAMSKPKRAGLDAGTSTAEPRMASGMRLVEARTGSRPITSSKGLSSLWMLGLLRSLGTTVWRRRMILGTAPDLISGTAKELGEKGLHVKFEGGTFRLGRGGNDPINILLGCAMLTACKGSLTGKQFTRRCTAGPPADLGPGPLDIGVRPRSA